MKKDITHEELTKLLNYDSESGLFTWKVNRGGRKIGDIAGTTDNYGYILITVNTKMYKAHRLAWFYCFQEWPENDIDHINGLPYDNKLDNLRDAIHANNIRNRVRKNKNNTSGFTGVSKTKHDRYEAFITFNQKKIHLGLFNTAEEASNARKLKAQELLGEYYNDH